jgi:hypothetical protein
MLFPFFKKDPREKVFLRNHNSILDKVIPYFRLVDRMGKAKAVVLWGDTRGRLKELALQSRKLKKPLIIVQHGRGAVGEYLPPINCEFLADKMCVWGTKDREKLIDHGIPASRIVLTGAPIFDGRSNKKVPHDGINVVFAPLHWDKEFEGNHDIYDALVKIPSINLTTKLLANAHDITRYGRNIVVTDQWKDNQLDITFELMGKTDILVSNEVGTLELIAMYFDIPVILIDNFKPMPLLKLSQQTIEEEKKLHPRPKGVDYTKDLGDLPELIKLNAAGPYRMGAEREKELNECTAVGTIKNPVQNIRDVILEAINNKTA